jgi:hypothetical protein
LSLEALSKEVLDEGRLVAGPLRMQAEALLSQLRDHMDWEDVHLLPALLATDVSGEERAEQLASEHREQRELLGYALKRIQDTNAPPLILARGLLDLGKVLRQDMEEEESLFLDERVLRDGVAGSNP